MRGSAPSRTSIGRKKQNPAWESNTCAGGVVCAGRGHSCDNWNFNASNPCLYVGGNYNQNGNHGLFYVNYNSASNSNANIGCLILLEAAKTSNFIAQIIAHPSVEISNKGTC